MLGILIYHLGTIYFQNPEEEEDDLEIMHINIFRRGYKIQSFIKVGLIYPAFLAWTLLGTVWYIENTNLMDQNPSSHSTELVNDPKENSTSTCFSSENTTSWYFLTWIITFYVIIIISTTVITYSAILYYRQIAFEMQYESLLQQYEEDERPQMNFNLYGLSPRQIIETSKVAKAKDNDGECSICIDEFKLGEKMRILNCGHRYHLPCIDVWLMQHTSCPLCKADFNRNSDLNA